MSETYDLKSWELWQITDRRVMTHALAVKLVESREFPEGFKGTKGQVLVDAESLWNLFCHLRDMNAVGQSWSKRPVEEVEE